MIYAGAGACFFHLAYQTIFPKITRLMFGCAGFSFMASASICALTNQTAFPGKTGVDLSVVAGLLFLLTCPLLLFCQGFAILALRVYMLACYFYSFLAVIEVVFHWFHPVDTYFLPWQLFDRYYSYDGYQYDYTRLRAQAVFPFPNDLAKFLVPAVYLVSVRNRLVPVTALRMLGTVLIYTATFITLSRSAILVCGAGVVYLLYCSRLPTATNARGWLAAVALCLAGLSVVYYNRLQSLLVFDDRSIQSRLEYWANPRIKSWLFPDLSVPLSMGSGNAWYSLFKSASVFPILAVLSLLFHSRLRNLKLRARVLQVTAISLVVLMCLDVVVSVNVVCICIFFIGLSFIIRSDQRILY